MGGFVSRFRVVGSGVFFFFLNFGVCVYVCLCVGEGIAG